MSRIDDRFQALREAGRKALVCFVTAGDPKPWVTVPLMHAMADAGADILELGVPFSDPMAEGPVIQAACERALAQGMDLSQVFGMVREFRKKNDKTPVLLMGYLNPVEVTGYTQFARMAAEAGVDGLLIVDMPPEEADDYRAAMAKQGLDTVFLLAPTSTDERIARICAASRGFVYYVSFKGVTGAALLDVDDVREHVERIRQQTDLPVGVGFGISDATAAAAVADVADAVVVGSALVKRIEALQDHPERIALDVASLVSEMRREMDKASR